MELWKALLISGLQNEHDTVNFVNDKSLKNVLESKCYKVLLQIKKIIEDKELR